MSTNLKLFLLIVFVAAVAAYAVATLPDQGESPPGEVKVVMASDLDWGALNPLRGDKGPRAGTLWGSRVHPVPSGFLVKFVDGFSSPPHIHPVTYRGVVISGEVHNDDPRAEKMWLPSGSFWTQPAGDVHITAARGSHNVAYIEIEKGPYLVRPIEEAFETDEQPVWMKASEMPWVDSPGIAPNADGVQVADLPGNPGDDRHRRALLELPSGFDGAMRSRGPTFHAVVVQGRPTHEVSGKTENQTLEPGSYFGSEGEVVHRLSCDAGEACILYVRTDGAYEVTPAR